MNLRGAQTHGRMAMFDDPNKEFDLIKERILWRHNAFNSFTLIKSLSLTTYTHSNPFSSVFYLYRINLPVRPKIN